MADMTTYMAEHWGNPSSAHTFGLQAREGVDRARSSVARLLSTEPTNIIFTASATEANNAAIRSALKASPEKRTMVVSATEHSAVLTFCRAQAEAGGELVVVPVLKSGVVDVDALAHAITPRTGVVSVMWANNETGVINPVETIGRLCRDKGVLFHCDAVQACGKTEINLRDLPIDYLTVSAHKMHGPKGAGAIALAGDAPFTQFLYGGHQEKGRRGGTENVPAIVGFGQACALARRDLKLRLERMALLRDRLERRILDEVDGTCVHGSGAPRVSNTANVGFAGVDADTLVALLDKQGICVSSGSACLSDSVTPSHVVLAMTNSYEQAGQAVRFSVSSLNCEEEIDRAVEAVKSILVEMRQEARDATLHQSR